MSGRLFVEDRFSCRCSCTKDWYSALKASTSLPSADPFSKSAPNSLVKNCKRATPSSPITIAGQEQLIPCPTSDREETVDSKQFTNSSRRGRASRLYSVFKYWLPTLFRPVITRFPARKSPSSIVGNWDWIGVTWPSHCSTIGKEEHFFSSAAGSRYTAPVLRRRDTPNLLQSGSERNCWRLNQPQMLQARTQGHHYPELTITCEIHSI